MSGVRMARPHYQHDADRLFEDLSVRLRQPWRLGEITYHNGEWRILVWHPTGPHTSEGISGRGHLMTDAMKDLWRRMENYERDKR